MSLLKPRVRAAGSNALLLDCGSLDDALTVFAALADARERGELEVLELVPAAETVLVLGGEARTPQTLTPKLQQITQRWVGTGAIELGTAEITIPVRYNGEDLAEVAGLTGLSVAEVVARHTAAHYTVAFTGFAPGFAYLSGGDPALAVPRRATPRPRILSGAVGLAGPFSGVYPRESPGGWQIIGATAHRMWDTHRKQPAALLAGGRVRFTAERESLTVAGADPRATSEPDCVAAIPSPTGNAVLRVIDAGLQSIIEDAGRRGVAGMGVGVSGVAVPRAYRLANSLVGNRAGAAALELAHGGFAVEAISTVVLAFTGASRTARVSGPFGQREAPRAAAFRLSAGERLTLGPPTRGLRSVLALRGGVSAPAILGSRSRDTLAGLGPDPLAAGDEIRVSDAIASAVAAPEADETRLPASGELAQLRVVFGPRDDWFEAPTRLTEQEWEVTPRSDRVGVRLAGKPLTRNAEHLGRELPSEGVALGSLQVPPDGQPVLFLADHPLTGGYPVVAVVHDKDLELAAQLAPGTRVRFVSVSPLDSNGGAAPQQADLETRS